MLNDSSGTQIDLASTALCRLGIHRSDYHDYVQYDQAEEKSQKVMQWGHNYGAIFKPFLNMEYIYGVFSIVGYLAYLLGTC